MSKQKYWFLFFILATFLGFCGAKNNGDFKPSMLVEEGQDDLLPG